jgi:hypothetical protein
MHLWLIIARYGQEGCENQEDQEGGRWTLRVEQPSLSVTDASKVIGAEWKALSEADKKRYQDMGEADRKRYSDEKEAKADS